MNDNRIPNEFEALLNERDAMIEAALGAEHVLGAAQETAQIARLLEQTREPDTAEIVPLKKRAHHTGKRIAILAAAAVLLISTLIVSVAMTKREFTVLGGRVRFENGHVVVDFPKLEGEPELTLSELENALREHGFDDVLIPGYFCDNEWEAEELRCPDEVEYITRAATFCLKREDVMISVYLLPKSRGRRTDVHFPRAESIRTITNGTENVYLVDHGEGMFQMLYFHDKYEYSYVGEVPVETMEAIADSILNR